MGERHWGTSQGGPALLRCAPPRASRAAPAPGVPAAPGPRATFRPCRSWARCPGRSTAPHALFAPAERRERVPGHPQRTVHPRTS